VENELSVFAPGVCAQEKLVNITFQSDLFVKTTSVYLKVLYMVYSTITSLTHLSGFTSVY